MRKKRYRPDDPREWLNRALSNLVQAKLEQPGIYYEDLCFNAQQATEKAVKALLLHRGVRFPYIHDLAELFRILEQSGEEVPPRIRDASQLTDYAVEARYPGLAEPVTKQEYAEALALAEEVVRWVKERLEAGST